MLNEHLKVILNKLYLKEHTKIILSGIIGNSSTYIRE